MGAVSGWAAVLFLAVIGVVGANHLGYDVTGPIGAFLRSAEHLFGQPLLPP